MRIPSSSESRLRGCRPPLNRKTPSETRLTGKHSPDSMIMLNDIINLSGQGRLTPTKLHMFDGIIIKVAITYSNDLLH